jgi:hypothetical protein
MMVEAGSGGAIGRVSFAWRAGLGRMRLRLWSIGGPVGSYGLCQMFGWACNQNEIIIVVCRDGPLHYPGQPEPVSLP